jgi:16S rRNA G527 N7-methylase RsmG
LALGAKEVVSVESLFAYTYRMNFFAESFNLNLQVINSRFEKFETENKFDFINCYGVFYFLKNQEQMIQKMYKLLNKNGYLHIETKIQDQEGNVKSAQLTEWLLNSNFTKESYDSFKRAYFFCKK